MCDSQNLIDLTGWDEPKKEETAIEEAQGESAIVESTSFKGPYDPFDTMEKEACIKGLNLQDQVAKPEYVAADIQFEYSDQDLNNETPPVAMDFMPTNADGYPQSLQKNIVQLNALRISNINTPPHLLTSKFSRNVILTENMQMISAESPIKLIEDEPNSIPSPAPVAVVASTSTSNLSDDTCSNIEFEERLKMLRIAMLDSHPKLTQNSGQISTTSSVKDVEKLLQELKSLICEHVDQSKIKPFNMLIESISVAVHAIASSSTGGAKDVHHVSPGSPHTYKRQATFDLDLEKHKKQSVESAEYAIGRKVQEFPDAMTCSSATFDGESLASDKAATPISIPMIDTEEESPKPFVDISSPQTPKSDSYVTEVINDNLALQINELLERHNLANQHQDESNRNEAKYVGGQTVILVVNSSTANQLSSCVVHPSTTRTMKPAAAATSSSSNTSKANTLRRRSSSLSIHDKSKQEPPRSLVKQSSGDSSSSIANVTNTQCMPLKELSVVGDKFNAMSSYRQRRNSFSVGLTAGKSAGATASSIAQGRALLSSRNKNPTINESNIKAKDVIPIKRVAPMVNPSSRSTDIKHMNSTMTPMPARSKPVSKLFCTSTPMPQMRSSQPNRTLKPVGSSNSNSSVRSSMSFSKK